MEKRQLLLMSSSLVYGQEYLEHGAAEIRALLGSQVKRVLFVPYAKIAWDDYTQKVRTCFETWNLSLTGIHETISPVSAVLEAEAIFIGGGNTFLLVYELYTYNLVEHIRRRVSEGMPYLGTSAGSNVAGLTIQTTNDMPIIYPPTFEALGLVLFNLNPHYIEPDPTSQHMGETRITRIREFHEHNAQPVVGLPESTMLRVQNSSVTLQGTRPAKIFRPGQEPEVVEPGANLAFLEQ